MKKLRVLLLILAVAGLFSQVSAQKKERPVVCYQSDMDCAECEKSLYEHLKFEKGVKDLKVDHASNTILIEYAEGKNDEKGFAGAIEKKGYKAEKISRQKYDELVNHAREQGHDHGVEVHEERD